MMYPWYHDTKVSFILFFLQERTIKKFIICVWISFLEFELLSLNLIVVADDYSEGQFKTEILQSTTRY